MYIYGERNIISSLSFGGMRKYIYDDGDKAGGAPDGTAGVAGGGDIRGVPHEECWKHAVGTSDDGEKAGGAYVGDSSGGWSGGRRRYQGG